MEFIKENIGIITAIMMGPYIGLILSGVYKHRSWDEINKYIWPGILFIAGLFLYVYAFISYDV